MSKSTARSFSNKKILIIHFRVGRTDGVSLQISSWRQILEAHGAKVYLCAGPISFGADFTINDLEQQLNPEIFALDEASFGPSLQGKQKQQFIDQFLHKQETIRLELQAVINQLKPDYLIVSNIFSVGENLPAAGALIQVLDQFKFPTLSIMHDFYWENGRYEKPCCAFINKQLDQFFPPDRDYIQPFCINSIAQKTLKKRKGIQAQILYDTFDFDQPKWQIDDFNSDFLSRAGYKPNDLILLQATRIVRRKNIEIAIDLVHQLQQSKFLRQLAGQPLINGKHFDPGVNQIVLVLAGYAEKRDLWYQDQLLQYAAQNQVDLYMAGDLIHTQRTKEPEKRYTLWDTYPFADIITYPSEYEGFGNQFLEAVFAQKPAAVFEYPVFKTDIAPKGFNIISLGDQMNFDSNTGLVKVPAAILESASQQIVDLLTQPTKYQHLVQKNFKLGQKHFSYSSAYQIFNRSLLTSTKR